MKLVLLTVMWLSGHLLYGQIGFYLGAAAAGSGLVGISGSEASTVFHNPAGIAGVERPVVSFHAKEIYQTQDLYGVGAVVAIPWEKAGTFSLSAQRVGDLVFNQSIFRLSYANRLGIARLGTSIGYYQLDADEYGITGVWTVDLGGITELFPDFLIGASINRLSFGTIDRNSGERLMPDLRLGISYQPLAYFTLFAEVEKELELAPTYHFGLEYLIKESLAIRSGFVQNPSILCLGVGFKRKLWTLDYAFNYHLELGMNNEVGLSIFLQK